MNNKLDLVKKAVEIFDLSVEIEKKNEEMCELIFSDNRSTDSLTELQDELFEKRLRLSQLEIEHRDLTQTILMNN